MEKIVEYKYIILVAVVAFALGFGASYFVGSRSGLGSSQEDDRAEVPSAGDVENLPPLPFSNTSSDNISGGGAESTGSVLVGDNAVAVEAQSAGDIVTISMLAFKEPAWVVIHEDRNGAPGNILGAGWFAGGTHTNVRVNLLRKTESGKAYYAMLHMDAAADKKFDKDQDLPLKDPNGSTLMIKFSVQ